MEQQTTAPLPLVARYSVECCPRTSVVDLRSLAEINTVHLARDGLEKRGTSRTRRAENNEQLSRLDDTVELIQNLDFVLAVADEVADLSEEVQRQVTNGLLVV